jgi:hypothetical protein
MGDVTALSLDCGSAIDVGFAEIEGATVGVGW